MGNVFCCFCDSKPPDRSVRIYWKTNSSIYWTNETIQEKKGGVLYIANGTLYYNTKKCGRKKANIESLRFELEEIKNIGYTEDGIDIIQETSTVTKKGKYVTFDLFQKTDGQRKSAVEVDNPKQVCEEIRQILSQHRQKPRILQFNSIDCDGVEVDVP